MNIIVSKKNPNFLVMIDTKFDANGFAIAGESRVGAIQWDETKFADKDEALEKAKTMDWELVKGDNFASTGYYDVVAK